MAARLAVVGVGVVHPHDRSALLAQNFAIDVITAEVASAFAGEGIGAVVLKGPVLAKWLYPDEVRPLL